MNSESDVDVPGESVAAHHRRSESRPRQTPRASVLAAGTSLGRYRVVRLLCRGGMSEVYEAVHISLQKSVALKVMNSELAASLEARQRFIAEAEHAARVRHPNVIDVTDVGIVDDVAFIVMALLEGEDLSAYFARRAPLPVTSAVDLILPVAAAVAAGHARGVIHRDLKPENIFLHREGKRLVPKLLDFGVSLSLEEVADGAAHDLLGTPRYMAPEQARGRGALDGRADQYALGIILYEAITGIAPRSHTGSAGMLHQAAYGGFPPPSEHAALPDGFEPVLLRALSREPAQRFDAMHDFARALLPFASELARSYWQREFASNPQGALGLDVALATVDALALAPDAALAEPAPCGARASAVSAAPESQEPTEIFVHAASPARRSPRTFVAFCTAFSLVLAAASVLYVHKELEERRVRSVASAPAMFEVRAVPSSAELLLDGRRVGVGHYRGALPKDGAQHELLAAADGYRAHLVMFGAQPPPRVIELTRVAEAAPTRAGEERAIAAQAAARTDEASLKPALPAALQAARPKRQSPRAAPALRAAKPELAPNAAAPTSAEAEAGGLERHPVEELRAAEGSVDDVVASSEITAALRPSIRIIDDAQPRVRVVE